MPSLPDPASLGRIVVFLPDDPFWLLFTLRHAGLLLERSPAGWLWQTLLHLGNAPNLLI